MTIPRLLIAAILCLFISNQNALAERDLDDSALPTAITDDDSWSLCDLRFRAGAVYWDNDGTYSNLVNDDDRYYTNGFGIELSFDPQLTDELQEKLAPSDRWTDPRFGVGLALKQHMYTGIDITDPNPPIGDHPFAGYLYLAFSFQRAETLEDWTGKHDHFELDLGVVGERSQGESLQEFIHNLFPGNDMPPQGWDDQLANELAINFTYERTWRTRKGDLFGLEFDMLPAVGFDVGNVFVRARTRATMRVGMKLPDDFGPATFLGHRDHTAASFADPDKGCSIFGYVTVGADAVARNIFLDGNTFATSRSVDKEPLVAQLTVGVLMRHRRIEFGWSQTWQTIEFENQPNGQTWGSWSLTWVKEF